MNQLTVQELKQRLDRDDKPLILDVREPWECDICRLPDSVHMPMGSVMNRLTELDPQRETVVICHHGIRSQHIAVMLQRAGFEHLHNLRGGIDAWARQLDPYMETY
ncbi:MAG: rhodanese-like domain-containing protein [Gammaproteobacteria bacterium]|nr:rhodanese-like domain-containing protein [Gammaproteobacteria bacterium]